MEWSISAIPGAGKIHCLAGYPLPVLPTGHRHAAFVLTDRPVDAGESVALPRMDAKWKDFTFRADGTVPARRTDAEPPRIAGRTG